MTYWIRFRYLADRAMTYKKSFDSPVELVHWLKESYVYVYRVWEEDVKNPSPKT